MERSMRIRPFVLGAMAVGLGAVVVSPKAFSETSRVASIETIAGSTDVSAMRRTVAVRGPRGNVAARTTVVRPGVRPGAWVRPAHYHWRPGGAIAAGAAIGFVAAATAAAWAGPPPGPRMCWYYTDPSRTQGFWDT